MHASPGRELGGENKKAILTMDIVMAPFKLVFFEGYPEEPTYLSLSFVNPKSVVCGSGIGKLKASVINIEMALWAA